MSAVLRATSILKTYHDGTVETPVLKGIDLTLARGDFVALMGPSGSGKSTLLAILGTLLRPTSGIVEIAGHDTSRFDEHELTRFRNRHLGFVFQMHHLLPDFSALENVLFPSLPQGGPSRPGVRERALQELRRVGLENRLDYRPAALSGGQKQRVAVARALMNRPDLVLADEPTGNLDRESSASVMSLLRDLCREEGMTFLISTHDADVAAVCDRVVHLVDGRIVPTPAERGAFSDRT
jgi:lipoprotein-releasing system ATP-binding protein